MMDQLQPTNTLQVSLSGYDLINSPRLNKGTAFTDHERDVFDLHGLLPPHIGSLDEQIERRLETLRAQPNSFGKYSFLRDLQDAKFAPGERFEDGDRCLCLVGVLVWRTDGECVCGPQHPPCSAYCPGVLVCTVCEEEYRNG